MRLDPKEHLDHPWLVSTLAPDFELLDVWRYPIEIDLDVPLDRFVEFIESSQGELVSKKSPAGALVRLRAALGKILRLDDPNETPADGLRIPGCSETSLRDRLSNVEGEAQPDTFRAPSNRAANSAFKPVYRLEAQCEMGDLASGEELTDLAVPAGQERVRALPHESLLAWSLANELARGHRIMQRIGLLELTT